MNKLIAITMMGTLLAGCTSKESPVPEHGNYAYDLELFKRCKIEAIDLTSADGEARILIIPSYQGRVMTSTANGLSGKSFGWINHEYIEKGEVAQHMHAVGGEERFWIGPEGGPFSVYFAPDKEQVYDNWQVPPFIDTDTYRIVERTDKRVSMEQTASLPNASGAVYSIKVNRTLTLLDSKAVEKGLDISIPENVKLVGYESANTMTNTGEKAWNKESGMPSIWCLSMLNSSPETTILVPYRTDAPTDTIIYNGNYFGEIPKDRISAKDGIIYFKADANYRAKLGLPYFRAKSMLGSYDSKLGQLTVLSCNLPNEEHEYLNAVWGNNEPFGGDAINAYNDGPKEDGSQFGKFYEIESSSPAAALAPGESITHVVRLVHFVGNKKDLNDLSRKIFGVELTSIEKALQP